LDDLTLVSCLCIQSSNINLSVLASLDNIARLLGALIAVVTVDCVVSYFTSGWNAVISGTCVLVINNLVVVDTSNLRITVVISARIAVITADLNVLASLCNVARILGALVSIIAITSSEDTLVGVNIT
jgi:hypothetical protein